MRNPILPILLLASPLFAQTPRILPPGYDLLEGNSSYAYPFRTEGAIQVIYGRDSFQTTGLALLSGMSYRVNSPFDPVPGFKKRMKVTLFGTTTSPAAMTTDPVGNIAGAKGTVAFDQELVLPAVAARPRAPGPFQLSIPFTAPFSLDVAKHDLLTQVEPGDATPLPSSSWTLDAVNHYTTKAFARKVKVGERCADASGQYLSLSVSSSSYNGSALGVSLSRPSATAVGAFPIAAIGLDFQVQRAGYPVDMTALGMPGCHLQINPEFVQFNPESASGTYTGWTVPIPNDPKLIGIPYLVQAIGFHPSTAFWGGVATDTYQVVNTGDNGVAPASQGIFYSAKTGKWSMSGVGAYYPVTRFDGIFL